ncbi:outer-membrane immunogenic protein [Brucella sp. 09RB8471]|nr:outer-membrane immunogenic protein [Brucella sp. 09RB8471]
MKSVLLASFAMLFASSAMAADAIVAEPAPVAVDTFSWTGGYIGINAGYAGGKFKHPFSVAGLPTAGMNEEGVLSRVRWT